MNYRSIAIETLAFLTEKPMTAAEIANVIKEPIPRTVCILESLVKSGKVIKDSRNIPPNKARGFKNVKVVTYSIQKTNNTE